MTIKHCSKLLQLVILSHISFRDNVQPTCSENRFAYICDIQRAISETEDIINSILISSDSTHNSMCMS